MKYRWRELAAILYMFGSSKSNSLMPVESGALVKAFAHSMMPAKKKRIQKATP